MRVSYDQNKVTTEHGAKEEEDIPKKNTIGIINLLLPFPIELTTEILLRQTAREICCEV